MRKIYAHSSLQASAKAAPAIVIPTRSRTGKIGIRDFRHTMEPSMRTRFALPAALALLAAPALAHHGWGSYDAANPLTVAGPIVTSKFENPHVTVTVRGSDKSWTVILAPISRMENRGAVAAVVAVGKDISAYGYPSNAVKDEMRAERITVDGKTYEMR
jgi:hypothetical protein